MLAPYLGGGVFLFRQHWVRLHQTPHSCSQTGTPGEKPRTPSQFALFGFFFLTSGFSPHLFAPTGPWGSPHSCGVQGFTLQAPQASSFPSASANNPRRVQGLTRRPDVSALLLPPSLRAFCLTGQLAPRKSEGGGSGQPGTRLHVAILPFCK